MWQYGIMASQIISCNNCGSSQYKVLHTFRGNYSGLLEKRFKVVLCKECGLGFLNPQPSHEDYIKHYSRDKHKPAPDKSGILSQKKYHRCYIQWLKAHSNIPKDAKILDIGCGTGTFLYFLKELGYHNVIGLEISPQAVRVAKEELGIEVYNRDFSNHNLPHESFDVIVGTALMEHMINPLMAIKEAAKLLKPGGLIYLNTPDLKAMNFRRTFFKFVHPYYFTQITLSSLLQQAGCKILCCLCMPTLYTYSNLLFPENCVSGELHILAKKIPHAEKIPLKDNYQEIVALYKKIKRNELFYAIINKLIFMKYGAPFRRVRRLFDGRLKKNRTLAIEEFFATL